MQYQTFNRSCAYAALANLLLDHGINIEDRDIAIEAMIPYHLRYRKDNKRFIAGPSLQGKDWFDLYLNKVGYEFLEEQLNKKDLVSELEDATTKIMLAIKDGNDSKHAIVFLKVEDEKYVFLNNKHYSSIEPERYYFSKNELIEKLENKTSVGKVVPIKEIKEKNIEVLFDETIKIIEKYRRVIVNEVIQKRAEDEQKVIKKNIFEALFLDIFSMMEIIKKDDLAYKIKNTRTKYLEAIKQKKTMSLSEYIDINEIENIIDEYMKVVLNKMNTFWSDDKKN